MNLVVNEDWLDLIPITENELSKKKFYRAGLWVLQPQAKMGGTFATFGYWRGFEGRMRKKSIHLFVCVCLFHQIWHDLILWRFFLVEIMSEINSFLNWLYILIALFVAFALLWNLSFRDWIEDWRHPKGPERVLEPNWNCSWGRKSWKVGAKEVWCS